MCPLDAIKAVFSRRNYPVWRYFWGRHATRYYLANIGAYYLVIGSFSAQPEAETSDCQGTNDYQCNQHRSR